MIRNEFNEIESKHRKPKPKVGYLQMIIKSIYWQLSMNKSEVTFYQCQNEREDHWM